MRRPRLKELHESYTGIKWQSQGNAKRQGSGEMKGLFRKRGYVSEMYAVGFYAEN